MVESVEHYGSNKTNCFKGKNILVTGATGGIGSLVTSNFIQLGAKVIGTVRNTKKVVDVLGKVSKHDSFDYEIINFENPQSINLGFLNIIKKFQGRLDIVVICHGNFHAGGIADTIIDDLDQIMNVNLRSIFHLISLSTPFLKLSKGNIVAVSSLESLIPVNNSFLNSLSKVK